MEGMVGLLYLIVVSVVTFSHLGNCCSDGFTRVTVFRRNKCIKAFPDLVDKYTAEQKCQEAGSSLIVFSSFSTYLMLDIYIRELRVFNIEKEFWVGLKVVDGKLTWLDNSSSMLTLFHITANYSDGDCFLIRNFMQILESNCSYPAPFICEKLENMISTASSTPKLPICPEGSVVLSDTCFWRTKEPLSYNETEAECAKNEGYLAEIHNSKFLEDITSATGILNASTHNIFWTTLFKVGNVLRWKDGQSFDFHSFPLHSVLPDDGGNCVVLDLNQRTELFFASCDFKALGLCQNSAYQPDVPMTSTYSSETGATASTALCPRGFNWKEDVATGFCYWETSYETERLSWDDARKFCQSYGGDLASFHSLQQEQIGLSFQYGSLEHPYWIGLLRDLDTGSYMWSDGSQVDYTNWDQGQPISTDRRMRCVQMHALKKKWIVSYCGVLSWFVCKAPKQIKPKTPVLPTPEPLINCAGSLSEYFFDGYCYETNSMVYTWHRASTFCENKGSHLISIHSEKEVDFLLRLLYSNRALSGNRVWIGLNSLGLNGEFQWTDNSIIDFTNWDSTEPNNFQNQENCCNMYSGNGFWNDENCNSPMGFVCKRKNSTEDDVIFSTTAQPVIGYCKKNWHIFDGRCYLPVGSKQMNWGDASLHCLSLGGHLASIRNIRDQAFLGFLMQELKSDAWIGLHDTIQSGLYYWTDNSHMAYSHWALGEPSIYGKKEDCVLMLYGSQNGFWADEVCERNLSFICQMNTDPTITTPPKSLSSRCIHPQGWLKSGNSCFKVYDKTLQSFQDAESTCLLEGAHLVSASDFSTQAVLEYLAITSFTSNETFWIGLQVDDVMTWINGWPFTVSKWDVNEPSYDDISNTCFVSSALGMWKTAFCQEEKKYICQIKGGKPPNIYLPKGHCPVASWIDIGTKNCFSVELQQNVEWYSAKFKCFVQGGDLTSFHSLDELNKVKSYIQSANSNVFIGMARNTVGGFMWSDGSPVDFVNWDQGEPKEGQCVALIIPSMKWRTVNCYTRLPYLCSFMKVYNKYDEENNNTLEIYSEHRKDEYQRLSSGTIVGIIFFILIATSGVIFAVYHFVFPRHRHLRLFNRESTSFENVLFSDDSNVEIHEQSSENLRN